ncbi:hypothetical protein WA026_001806 [Henosepilachna vigintioctopunctata]|uniref:Uncharacterized protein n=1 Tax=Henosepilachna vigintioctopunctata TaxID=420089 RepID=A0AAW1UVM8_9CUCU
MIDRHPTRNSVEKNRDLRREEKKMQRKKKRIYMEEKYTNIENLKTQREARKFYELVNDVRKDLNSRAVTLRKRNGELSCNSAEKMERWREHFEEVLFERDDPQEENNVELSDIYPQKQEAENRN